MFIFDASGKEKDKEKAESSRLADKLFDSRSIFVCGEITQKLARDVMMQLVAMSAESNKDITIYLNSQGGHVESGDTLHDMIKFIKPHVKIVGTGWVASAGTHIFLSVPKENRVCLPNTRFLIHQPMGGIGGQAADIKIEAQEIIKMRKRLNQIIARETGQPLERVEQDTDRNFWMTATEAMEYGLVGKIISSMDEL
jgi:ATP-dependent Clp protease protease subunit